MLEILNTGRSDKLKNLKHGQAFMFKQTDTKLTHKQNDILYMLTDEESYVDLTDDVGALYPLRAIMTSDCEIVELYKIVKIQAEREW